MSGKTRINVHNYCTLHIKIFESINNINPKFVKETFRLRITNCPTKEKYKVNLETPKSNQVRFGTKSLRYLVRKIWNTLPYNIKSSGNLSNFETLIKSLNGTNCMSKICQI